MPALVSDSSFLLPAKHGSIRYSPYLAGTALCFFNEGGEMFPPSLMPHATTPFLLAREYAYSKGNLWAKYICNACDINGPFQHSWTRNDLLRISLLPHMHVIWTSRKPSRIFSQISGFPTVLRGWETTFVSTLYLKIVSTLIVFCHPTFASTHYFFTLSHRYSSNPFWFCTILVDRAVIPDKAARKVPNLPAVLYLPSLALYKGDKATDSRQYQDQNCEIAIHPRARDEIACCVGAAWGCIRE